MSPILSGEVLPGTGVDEAGFWSGLASIVGDLAPRNRDLLAKRAALQETIDAWYREHGAPSDMEAYKAFLTEIGYLVPEGPAFSVDHRQCRSGDRDASPGRSSSCR